MAKKKINPIETTDSIREISTTEIIKPAARERDYRDRVYQQKPQSLESVLSKVISIRKLARSTQNNPLNEDWKIAAGDRIDKMTQVGDLKNGTLIIYVNNSALLGDLVSFHKHSLLEAMQKSKSGQNIRQLKFRLKKSAGKSD